MGCGFLISIQTLAVGGKTRIDWWNLFNSSIPWSPGHRYVTWAVGGPFLSLFGCESSSTDGRTLRKTDSLVSPAGSTSALCFPWTKREKPFPFPVCPGDHLICVSSTRITHLLQERVWFISPIKHFKCVGRGKWAWRGENPVMCPFV